MQRSISKAYPKSIAFPIPIYPGRIAEYGPNPTSAHREEVKYLFDLETAHYQLYQHAETVLTTALFEAVDRDYWDDLPVDGDINTQTCLELLTHLHARYGRITAVEITANKVELCRDWHPDEPIVKLWARVTECRRFAAEGNCPISPIEAIIALLEIFERTGVFESAIDGWRARDEDTWTLELFQDTFKRASVEVARKNSARNEQINTLKAQIAALQLPLSATAAPATKAPRRRRSRHPSAAAEKRFYCWTHGVSGDPGHTSRCCRHPKAGHRIEATMEHRLGGSKRRGVRTVTPTTTAPLTRVSPVR